MKACTNYHIHMRSFAMTWSNSFSCYRLLQDSVCPHSHSGWIASHGSITTDHSQMQGYIILVSSPYSDILWLEKLASKWHWFLHEISKQYYFIVITLLYNAIWATSSKCYLIHWETTRKFCSQAAIDFVCPPCQDGKPPFVWCPSCVKTFNIFMILIYVWGILSVACICFFAFLSDGIIYKQKKSWIKILIISIYLCIIWIK